jgi:hypothetical protein
MINSKVYCKKKSCEKKKIRYLVKVIKNKV